MNHRPHTKRFSAFSLMEMSIVILVIGILVAGITQGSRLIAQSRLNTARNQTTNSPVNSIRGLSLWLETSMEKSFLTAQADDNIQITQWNDINSQSPYRLFAVTTASANIIYRANGIGGLPSIFFTGTTAQKYLTLSSTPAPTITPTIVQTADTAFTFFLVAQLDGAVTSSDSIHRVAFSNGIDSGWGYYRNGPGSLTTPGSADATTGKRIIAFNGTSGTSYYAGSSTTSAPELISGTYAGGVSGAVKLYFNGGNGAGSSGTSDISSTATMTAVPPAGAFYVGNQNYTGADGLHPWKGMISEIIIFDSVLKAADRREVEKYLAKKYGIPVV